MASEFYIECLFLVENVKNEILPIFIKGLELNFLVNHEKRVLFILKIDFNCKNIKPL